MDKILIIGLCAIATLCVNIAFHMGESNYHDEIIAECEATFDKALQSILECERRM